MSLDSLRKLRVRAQEAVMMELAHITQELVRMECQCDTLETQIQADASACQAQTEQGVAVETMLEWQWRLDSRRTALRKVHEAIRNLTNAWTAVQARLIDVTQERKVLDRLAERQQKARDADLQRREQQATDEAAGRAWGVPGKGVL